MARGNFDDYVTRLVDAVLRGTLKGLMDRISAYFQVRGACPNSMHCNDRGARGVIALASGVESAYGFRAIGVYAAE